MRTLLLALLFGCGDAALPTPSDMGGTLCPFAPVMVCDCCCPTAQPQIVCVQRGQTLESVRGPSTGQCPPNAGCTQPVVYECCD